MNVKCFIILVVHNKIIKCITFDQAIAIATVLMKLHVRAKNWQKSVSTSDESVSDQFRTPETMIFLSAP